MSLRPVTTGDFDYLFTLMQDPRARRMAAFVSERSGDRAAFEAHWARVLASGNVNRIVLLDGAPAGHTAVYGPPGGREVTYWIDRAHWGRGVGTAALTALLDLVLERPLHARAAADNAGSIRVLRRCGFEITGHDRGWAHARGAETDEVLLTLPV
ncbi:GNAT family N-acetyltransferase [Streptomyces sudanensis]|uniref:GNAT family N-acetyltransferase n=1 Tax=Streptomyces sudanensis TaxID=436397 RepID=UPI0020CC7DCB|nr:GNAT family N-acetyltransferase [Streptomyces sudanensis]